MHRVLSGACCPITSSLDSMGNCLQILECVGIPRLNNRSRGADGKRVRSDGTLKRARDLAIHLVENSDPRNPIQLETVSTTIDNHGETSVKATAVIRYNFTRESATGLAVGIEEENNAFSPPQINGAKGGAIEILGLKVWHRGSGSKTGRCKIRGHEQELGLGFLQDRGDAPERS